MKRHRYRRPRFRPFKASLLARAPGLMLIVGLVLSAGAHLGLGYVLHDRPVAMFDAAALEKDRAPVRIKRARFDQLLTSDHESQAGQEPPDAQTLAQALMEQVQTQDSAVLDPELELRQVPEPLAPLPVLAAATTQGIDFEQLLGQGIQEPAELVLGDASPGPGAVPAGADVVMAGELLAQLSSAEGGLPAMGAGGRGTGFASGAAGGGGGGGGGGGEPGSPGSGAGVGANSEVLAGELGMDFLDFGQIDPADFAPPQRLDDDFTYRTTRLDPTEAEPGTFRVSVTGKRSLRKLATMSKDVIFMVDTSRSIPEKTIRQVARGIQESIRTLNPDDRFNMVFFNQDVRFYAQQPVSATAENLAIADRWLRAAKPRGSTDVNLAVRQLLRRDLEPGRVYELILISDGKPTMGVLDTRELINLITRENDLAASIYCVGIGRAIDTKLLDFLAYRNKGFSLHVARRDEIAQEIRDLMSRLRYPIISDVQVRFAGTGMEDVYPLYLPNIHQGEIFEIFGRFKQAGPFTMQITGRSGGKPVDFTYRAELSEAPEGENGLAHRWAFWKLHHLYSEIIRLGERQDLLSEIQALRTQYALETLY